MVIENVLHVHDRIRKASLCASCEAFMHGGAGHSESTEIVPGELGEAEVDEVGDDGRDSAW